jgi:catechol 2,3-dioxygenase-like lactoylglutathione lyase family enzyme
MITGGNATVYVSNMDNAVRFYTEVLGLKLTNRFGDNWATVQAGTTLVIGLHPWSAKFPRPGTRGAVQLGFFLSPGASLEALAARLRQHGVVASAVIASIEANYIQFEDPDGNPIYVGDRNPGVDAPAAPKEAVGSSAG